MKRRLLLASGILAPGLYAFADVVAGSLRSGYSFRDQTISELGAIGAPTRGLFSALILLSYVFLTAFGFGVWRSAAGSRRLRLVGALITTLGVMALTVGWFVPMRERGEEQGLTGLLHLVEGGVAMLIIFSAIGIGGTAFGPRFRWYSFLTFAVVLVFGAWSVSAVGPIGAGEATPWVGVRERVMWYGYQLWWAVLALRLLRGKGRLGAAAAENVSAARVATND